MKTNLLVAMIIGFAAVTALAAKPQTKMPLQECSGSFSLSGIKVQSSEVEEDIGLETLLVPIAKGLFDQTLDGIVQAFHRAIG